MNWGFLSFLLLCDSARQVRKARKQAEKEAKQQHQYLYSKGYEDAINTGRKNPTVLNPSYDSGFNAGMKIRLIPDEDILRLAPKANKKDFNIIRDYMLKNKNLPVQQLQDFVNRKNLKRALGYLLWSYLLLFMLVSSNSSPFFDALGKIITVVFIIHLLVVLFL